MERRTRHLLLVALLCKYLRDMCSIHVITQSKCFDRFRLCVCPNRNRGISQCALQVALKTENLNTYEKLLLWAICCEHRCSG